MAKPLKLEEKSVENLLSSYRLLAVGATMAEPGLFPGDLGVGMRSTPRNQYLGMVVTRPEQDTFVFGLNYFDTKDGCDNEDIYRLDRSRGEVDKYMKGPFEKEFPQYAGTHWAAKPYLRKPDESS